MVFGVEIPGLLDVRYNIAPSQSVAAVRDSDNGRELVTLRWGLIPSWTKDLKGPKPINARSESVASNGMFRGPFRKRRCLVIADGFYEWKKTGGNKQPYYIGMTDEKPFAFAGLWDEWTNPEGEIIESCTLLTTTPNELVKTIHNRMPVILPTSGYATWLSQKITESSEVLPMLKPYPADEMNAFPVSTLVNNPSNDSPKCIEPIQIA